MLAPTFGMMWGIFYKETHSKGAYLMTIFTPVRFIKALHKNQQLINYILTAVPQETAASAWDGDWNVIGVLCHLRDFDQIFYERANLMNDTDNPTLTPRDHEQLAQAGDYNHQNLAEVLAQFNTHRTRFIEWLEALPAERFARGGFHPENGQITILEQAAQVATHDIDHLEQMMRALHAQS